MKQFHGTIFNCDSHITWCCSFSSNIRRLTLRLIRCWGRHDFWTLTEFQLLHLVSQLHQLLFIFDKLGHLWAILFAPHHLQIYSLSIDLIKHHECSPHLKFLLRVNSWIFCRVTPPLVLKICDWFCFSFHQNIGSLIPC